MCKWCNWSFLFLPLPSERWLYQRRAVPAVGFILRFPRSHVSWVSVKSTPSWTSAYDTKTVNSLRLIVYLGTLCQSSYHRLASSVCYQQRWGHEESSSLHSDKKKRGFVGLRLWKHAHLLFIGTVVCHRKCGLTTFLYRAEVEQHGKIPGVKQRKKALKTR